MAVSSSIDFSLTTQQLIVAARRKAGIHADEEPLAASDLEADMVTLNLMLKAWQTDGVMIWTMTEDSMTLVQAQASYNFQSGGDFATVPIDIVSMRINRGGNDIPMFRISRREYYELPNKTSQGYPTQFFYDRQRSSGVLYVWPVPDATAGTVKFTYRRRIMDLDDQADDFDIPQEWHDAVVYGLADRLMEDYGMSVTPEGQKITARAVTSYEKIKAYDTGADEDSIMIVPDRMWG